MSDDAHDATQALTGHLIELVKLVDPLRDATMGYRNSLVEKGLDKTAADRCAADFHHWMVASIMPKGSYGVGGKVT